MHVNGCHIVSTLSSETEEGFLSTVSRTVITVSTEPQLPSTEAVLQRGPFTRINDAIMYAMSWNDPTNPPPIPAAAVTGTASASQAIPIPIPCENPPLAE